MWGIKLNQTYLVGLVLSGLVLAAGIFLYQYDQTNKQNLINYIPQGSWYYWQINFNQPELIEELKQNLALKKQIEDWLLESGLPVNIWRGDYRISQLALVKVEIKDDNDSQPQTVQAWLIYSPDDLYSLVATELKDYYCKFLNRHIALLTTSEKLITTYQAEGNFNYLFLNNSTDKQQVAALGFIELDKYFAQLAKEEDKNFWLDYIQVGNKLNWILKAESGKFELAVNLPITAKWNYQSRVNSSHQARLLKALPVGTAVWFDFDPQAVLNLLDEELSRRWQVSSDEFKSFMESKYQVELDKLYTFFKQPFYVVIRPRAGQQSLKNLFKTQSYEYALVSDQPASDEVLNNLKQLISSYLAFQSPTRKIKTLPDGSQGWELVADSQAWPWQEQQISRGRLGSLKIADYEVSYFNHQQGFMLSNSEKLIKDILLPTQVVELSNKPQADVWIERHFWQAMGLSDWFDIYLTAKRGLNRIELQIYFKK